MTESCHIVHFCFGHRLRGVSHKDRFLHGHNAVAEIFWRSGADAAPAAAAEWIDNNIDHRMLLETSDPVVPLLRAEGEPVVTLAGPPTSENVARWIFEQLQSTGAPVQRVTVWETLTGAATYEAD